MVFTALPFFLGCQHRWLHNLLESVSFGDEFVPHPHGAFFLSALLVALSHLFRHRVVEQHRTLDFSGRRFLESTRLWQPLFGVLASPEEYRSSDIFLALFTGEIWTLFQRAPRFRQSRVSCLGRLRCSPRIDFPGRLAVPVSTVDTVHRSMYGGIHGEFYQCST